MGHFNGKEFIKKISNQINILNELSQVLKEEKEMISRSASDALSDIGQKKSKIYHSIGQIEAEKQQMLSIHTADQLDFDPSSTPSQLLEQILPKEEFDIYQSIKNDFKSKLDECMQINRINGIVISANLHNTNHLLAALTGQPSSSTYGSSGKIESNHRESATIEA